MAETLDRTVHLDALARDGAAFIDACARAGLDRPAPTCGEWSVADLVWHLTGVYRFFEIIVRERRSSPDSITRGERPADIDLLDLCRDAHRALIAALDATPDDTAVWTWAEDHSVRFVRRRMAQETLIHRWDAENAAGDPQPIDATLASDGIDEFLFAFLPRVNEGTAPVNGSVHIHCGDVEGEWTIRAAADGSLSVAREHAKGDCALRGRASDLLLALWRRVPLSSVEVIGDVDVAARFVARTRL